MLEEIKWAVQCMPEPLGRPAKKYTSNPVTRRSDQRRYGLQVLSCGTNNYKQASATTTPNKGKKDCRRHFLSSKATCLTRIPICTDKTVPIYCREQRRASATGWYQAMSRPNNERDWPTNQRAQDWQVLGLRGAFHTKGNQAVVLSTLLMMSRSREIKKKKKSLKFCPVGAQ